MKTAIMQPYFLPYIGYFQLIKAVNTFVIYDDVNYIKQGWINRNRILAKDKFAYFTLNLNGASSFKKINEINTNFNAKKLLKTIHQSYSKAPFFDEIYTLLENIFRFDSANLSCFVTNSIVEVSKHLEINTKIEVASEIKVGTSLSGQDRVIEICKYFNSNTYINAIGGQVLYSKKNFNKEKIKLYFLRPDNIEYKQFNSQFIPFLSIIDIMMFNSKNQIIKYLENYELI